MNNLYMIDYFRLMLAAFTWLLLGAVILIGFTYPYLGMFLLGMQVQAFASMIAFKGWDETIKIYRMYLRPYVGLPIF